MNHEDRLRRLKFRAWHRGTREADYMIGCFFDRYGATWNEAEIVWFERLLDEEDVDIMGWALGTIAIPDRWQGPMMEVLKRLDYIALPVGLGKAG